jgi:hypothetical protein
MLSISAPEGSTANWADSLGISSESVAWRSAACPFPHRTAGGGDRAGSRARAVRHTKAVIMIFLPVEGAPLQDLCDLKRHAPREIPPASSSRPRRTSRGIRDLRAPSPGWRSWPTRFALFIRCDSWAPYGDPLTPNQCFTGRTRRNRPAGGGLPWEPSCRTCEGRGRSGPSPRYVGLSPPMGHNAVGQIAGPPGPPRDRPRAFKARGHGQGDHGPSKGLSPRTVCTSAALCPPGLRPLPAAGRGIRKKAGS